MKLKSINPRKASLILTPLFLAFFIIGCQPASLMQEQVIFQYKDMTWVGEKKYYARGEQPASLSSVGVDGNRMVVSCQTKTFGRSSESSVVDINIRNNNNYLTAEQIKLKIQMNSRAVAGIFVDSYAYVEIPGGSFGIKERGVNRGYRQAEHINYDGVVVYKKNSLGTWDMYKQECLSCSEVYIKTVSFTNFKIKGYCSSAGGGGSNGGAEAGINFFIDEFEVLTQQPDGTNVESRGFLTKLWYSLIRLIKGILGIGG